MQVRGEVAVCVCARNRGLHGILVFRAQVRGEIALCVCVSVCVRPNYLCGCVCEKKMWMFVC